MSRKLRHTNHQSSSKAPAIRVPAYAPPALRELGSVHGLTLKGCRWQQKHGASEELEYMGMSLTASSC
jgi:hypothetical protein